MPSIYTWSCLLNFFCLTRGFLHKCSRRCCCGLAIDRLYPFRIPNHNIPYMIANMSPYYFTIARWNEFQCHVDSCSATLLGGVGVIHLFKMWMKLMTWKKIIHIHVHVDDDFYGWMKLIAWKKMDHVSWHWTYIFHDMKILMKWCVIIKFPQKFDDIDNMDEILMSLGSLIWYLS